MVFVVTVDYLLLREGLKFTILDLIGSLNSTDGREGPARAAIALILNGIDSTFLPPINRILDLDVFLRLRVVQISLIDTVVATKSLLPFFRSVVSEFVDGQSSCRIVSGIVGFNSFRDRLELGISHFELTASGVGLAILDSELHELLIGLGHDTSQELGRCCPN
jgi:hypothetical protein